MFGLSAPVVLIIVIVFCADHIVSKREQERERREERERYIRAGVDPDDRSPEAYWAVHADEDPTNPANWKK